MEITTKLAVKRFKYNDDDGKEYERYSITCKLYVPPGEFLSRHVLYLSPQEIKELPNLIEEALRFGKAETTV